MVSRRFDWHLQNAALLAWPVVLAEDEVPLLQRLDPQRKAQVLVALSTVVLLGFVLLGVVWVGGRWVRRQARRRVAPVDRGVSDWDRKQPGNANEPPLDSPSDA